MLLQTMRAELKTTIGFLDPGLVNEKLIRDSYQQIEDYVFNAFVKLQNKSFILLPYNFK